MNHPIATDARVSAAHALITLIRSATAADDWDDLCRAIDSDAGSAEDFRSALALACELRCRQVREDELLDSYERRLEEVE